MPFRTWLEPKEIEVPAVLREAVGGHPLVAKTLARRGFRDVQAARAFLDPTSYTPAEPEELPGIPEAADRLQRAIRQNEGILVWGDFDVDGQTATTLLVSALRDLGARVAYHIPVRAEESHGVKAPVLSEILDSEPDLRLLLTCDTGIAAHEAVELARRRGVEVVISDHHDLPQELPQANAIVNPKLLAEGHPLGTLPGVGVAYKLMEALYSRAGRLADLEAQLDLVALGIVADVALQTGDTRYLLQKGLDRLRENHRLGLQVMLELAELDPTWLTEEHIGFVIGPRLNALGRLADANWIVEFLTTQDKGRARVLAYELQALNQQRKFLTDQVFKGAVAQIERDPGLLEQAALVLAHPSWPAGVIGIVASRLVERYGKPTVLISAPPEEMGRGSARSIEGVHITDAIAAQRDLLQGFGGHPMAAGLSIDPELIPEFRRGLSHSVEAMLAQAQIDTRLQIDGYLSLSELDLDLAADLERLSPFGAGNPPLTLASRGVRLAGQRTMGRDSEHVMLTVEDEQGETRPVVWWQGAATLDLEPLPEGRFDMAYILRASTFGGKRDVQLEWLGYRHTPETVVVTPALAPEIEVIDLRGELQPLPVLKQLQSEIDLRVWGEGEARERLNIQTRSELAQGESLAIYTIPPGMAELQAALERVRPQRVYLFGVDPGMDEIETFLRRLAGLAKFSLKKGGETSLELLSAATAQREATVRKGLSWLAAQGYLQWQMEGDRVQLLPGEGRKGADAEEITAQLKALLGESAAFRGYYLRAEPQNLARRVAE